MSIISRSLPLFLVLGAVLSTGCPSVDDGDTDPVATDTDVTPAPTQTEDGIHGDWVSAGDDVSTLLAFSYEQIDASFESDGTYLVVATDGDGGTTDFAGTYVVDISTTPPTIVLTQTTPTAAVAEGIWQVEADGSLTYEVIQTTPDIGFAPPTPAGGFGSSSGPGLAAGANVQIYR